ncbi:FKBP-type peptidyl-prolyl cis-trans isomerase [Aurantivibrio plasticivorans]
MSELQVSQGTKVTLHFAIKLDDGTVVDSTFDRNPATFEVGDKNLLDGFEQLLMGLVAGDKQSFRVTPEQGFGQRNPNNMQEIPLDAFDIQEELSEGLMVSFADANGAELPGVVHSIDNDKVIVDFNHPLAGRDLLFDVDIIDVQVAVSH